MNSATAPPAGRRVLITGAARGIGAAVARRLYTRGARLALVGLEPELLGGVSRDCGDAPWHECDVTDREQVERAVRSAAEELGGLDVVIANAGVAAQMPLIGGDPAIFERTLAVNVLGVYYTLRAAGPHISHPRGYALAMASVAALVHPPLTGAYSASKSAVEALADTLRIEMRPTGARVGLAYLGPIDTDMTRRSLQTKAAASLTSSAGVFGRFTRTTPLSTAVDAIERGVERRARHVVAPGWVRMALHLRMLVQGFLERRSAPGLQDALALARSEDIQVDWPPWLGP